MLFRDRRQFAWALLMAASAMVPAKAAAPVLIVGSSSNPFTAYYGEILRAEGITTFDYADLSTVTASTLAPYEVAILGESPLTTGQVTLFTDWVNAGGRLIAMRPDHQLAGLLGLVAVPGTLSNAYLAIDTTGPPGTGIVGQTIQFHGTADLYTIGSATAVARLYSTATAPTTYPALTLRSVGSNGGGAAAFTYDLAKSIIYARQGNPAWAGQERDGVTPVRTDDMFFGPAASDPQPDWVDRSKIAIPQADEQQRLLVNLILHMNRSRTPVPRFWYFPFGKKAVVVMTGDDHGGNGTPGRFDDFIMRSPTGCSVANWECVRGTSYVVSSTPLTDSQAHAYDTQGFEVGLHVDTGCADFTPTSLETFFSAQLQTWSARFTSLPPPVTNRTHCIVWSDWVTQPEVESAHNIRLDTNYYHWPGSWLQTNGFFTGSGIPMRFARLNGSTVNVYQAATQLTDESGQTYPDAAIALMDNALGPSGYYGAFTANLHTDASTGNAQVWAGQVVAAAQARSVPVVSARQLLTWLDGRNSSTFNVLSWTGGVLTFSITPGTGAVGLQAMLPASNTAGGLAALTRGGSQVTYSLQSVKGVPYAVFGATSGTYQATYAPTAVSVSVAPATVTLAQGQTQQFTPTVTGSANTGVLWSYSPGLGTLSDTGLYTAPIGASATVVITATAVADPSRSATATITVATSAPPVISAVEAQATDAGTATVTWTTDHSSDSRVDYGTSPAALDLSVTNPTLLTSHSFTLAGLSLGSVYYYRVSSTDSSGLRTTWPPSPGPPATFVARSTLSIWSSSIVPGTVDSGDSSPIELGLKFRSDVAGQVVGVRFYKAAANAGTHTGSLWTAAGSRLTTVTFSAENATGWQTAYFSAPVSVTPSTTYVVSYYAPVGHYSDNSGAFASSGSDNAPLHALANGVDGPNGLYVYAIGGGFPNASYNSTNYWVDVVFVPASAGAPPAITAITAFPNGGGTAQITWATDKPATSRIDYGTSADALTLSASDATMVTSHGVVLSNLAPGATYYYRVVSADASGNSATSPAPPASPATFTEDVASVWSGSAAPPAADFGDSQAIEVGLKFRADSAGQVLGVRFYKSAANTGSHVGSLWSSAGTLLATAAFTNETSSGWQNVYFPQPVSVTANTAYVVSYFAPAGHYAGTTQAFATQGVDSPPLHALANGVDGPNGLYHYGTASAFPTSSFNAANYWVDVLFRSNGGDTMPPLISAISASPSGTSAVITWTTNEPSTSRIDYGTSPGSLTLNGSDAALVTSHSLTLTGLTAGSTCYYRVTSVDGSGNSSTSPPTAEPALFFIISDTTPPVISSVAATAASISATITWTTNEPADSRVDYGTTSALGLTATTQSMVTTHSVTLTGLAPGTTYSFRVTSSDSAANSASFPTPPSVATFMTTASGCPCSVFSASDVPATIDESDAAAVELGMKFRSDVAGYITGIRFYKASTNMGTHTGHLWSSAGVLLGSVTFTGETASGWQQAAFTAPIPVQANTTYVVSYYAPAGHYSANSGYFSSHGVDRVPLHALADGVDGGNGVYVYGSSAFPTQTYYAANYWVDIVFDTAADQTPPVISGVTATPATTSATISWATNEPANSRVDYGTSATSLNLNTGAAFPVTAHTITLTGLAAGMTYFYRVTSADGSNNSAVWPDPASSAASFTTVADTTPPTVSAVMATPAATSTTITWTTDELSDSRVDYGASATALTLNSVSATPVTAHSATLSGLTSGRTYFYRVTSRDAAGNSTTSPAVALAPLTFDTADIVPPAISAISASPGANSAVLVWTTDEPSNSRVDYGTSPAALTSSVSNASLVTAHGVTLTQLTPSTMYYYRVTSADAAANSSSSPVPPATGNFTTTSSDTAPPAISALAAAPGNTSAVVSWTTDEPSDSRVDYGTISGALTTTVTSPGLVSSHSLTLNGLSPGMVYYFRVTSVDASANAATSPQAANPALSFSTTAGSGPVISGIAATTSLSGTATVAWTTSVAADSHVDYGTSVDSLVQSVTDGALVTTHAVTLTRLSPGATYYFRVSSTDEAGRSATSPASGESPASFTLFASVWNPAAVPAQIDDGDNVPAELGLKFRSDVDGFITGVRFYKAVTNTGTHTGSLWSVAGALLAQATFSGETASGWQQANFATPVPITANTVYVVSYHAPVGHYSSDQRYFTTSGTENPPLHALREGDTGSNGVYAYGTSITFPTSTYRSSNYWVDVVFRSASAPLVTARPEQVAVESGTLRSGDVSRLNQSDNVWYQVNSTTASPYTTSWYATLSAIPKSLANLRLAYEGKNSRSCTQTVALWRWTDGSWVQLDSRSVGTTEVFVSLPAPAGTLADFVSGTGTEGTLRVRVRCTASASFYSSGDLMLVSFDRN